MARPCRGYGLWHHYKKLLDELNRVVVAENALTLVSKNKPYVIGSLPKNVYKTVADIRLKFTTMKSHGRMLVK